MSQCISLGCRCERGFLRKLECCGVGRLGLFEK